MVGSVKLPLVLVSIDILCTRAGLPVGALLPNIQARYFPDLINTLRTVSFKLFKRPLPGFLTILTL